MFTLNRQILISAAILLLTTNLLAEKVYVNQDNGGSANGTTIQLGYPTIQQGIDYLSGGDAPDTLFIVASDSAYTATISLDLDLTIIGIPNTTVGSVADTVFMTAQDSAVFEVPTFPAVSVEWKNLVFQDSYSAVNAALEYPSNQEYSLTFTNCTFRNTAGTNNVGGLNIEASNYAIINVDSCTFSGLQGNIKNSAINIENPLNVTITNSTFLNNTTASKGGGAIGITNASADGKILIQNSLFNGNTAPNNNGGAVYIFSFGRTEITESRFFNNSSSLSAGAVYAKVTNYDTTSVHHSVFSGNSANSGGSIAMEVRGMPQFYNNTFYNNTATVSGIDLSLDDLYGDHIIRNNIFYGSDNELSETKKYIQINPADPAPDIDVSYNRVPSNGTTHNTNSNHANIPNFVFISGSDPTQYDFHLSSNSYLINRGAYNTETFGDYFNEPEPNGDRVNLGVYGNTEEATVAGNIEFTDAGYPLVPQNDTLTAEEGFVEALPDSNWFYAFEVIEENSDSLVFDSTFSFTTLSDYRAGVGWIPANMDVGEHTVRVRATDGPNGYNRTGEGTLTITVSNVNDPVQFVDIPGDTTIYEDSTLTLYFPTIDPDTVWGDYPWFSSIDTRDSLYVTKYDNTTGQLTWTPGNAEVGLNSISIAAHDSGTTDTATVNITVLNSDPQIAETPDGSVTEADSFVTYLDELTNDEGSQTEAFYYKIQGPEWLGFHTRTDSTIGRIRGVPYNNDVTVGFSDTVIVEFTDGNGGTSQDTFLVTVENRNNPPDSVSAPGWTTLLEDSTYIGYFTFNDSDLVHPGEDSLGFEIDYNTPESVSIEKVGLDSAHVTWIPLNNEVGQQTLTVVARDGVGETVESSVSVTIENQPPALADTILWNISQGIQDTLDLDASDEGGIAEGYQFTNPPDIDTSMALNQNSGRIVYNPTNIEVGIHSLEMEFNDGNQPDSVVSSVLMVNVMNVNDPPQITSVDTGSVYEDSLFTYFITATDPDSVLGDTTINFSLDDTLKHMTLSGDTLRWRPFNASVGLETIRIVASDTTGATDTLDLKVTVRNTNDPPVFTTMIPDTSIIEDSTFTYTITVHDSDLTHGGEDLVFDWPGFTSDSSLYIPANDTLEKTSDSTAVFGWQPPNTNVGAWNIGFRVTDIAGVIIEDSATVTVTNAVPAQIALPDTAISEDILWTYDLDYSDEDTTNGWWKAWYGLATNVGFSDSSWIQIDSSAGVISVLADQPHVDSSAIAPIRVQVLFRDGNGGSRDTSFGLTITNRNDTPVFAEDTISMQVEEGQRWLTGTTAQDQDRDPLTYADTLYSTTSGKLPDDLVFVPTAEDKFDWLIPKGEGYDGTYYFGLIATDPAGAGDTLVYELQIVDASDPPELTVFPDTLIVNQGRTPTFTFEATDLDYETQDGDVIHWSIQSSGDLSGFLTLTAADDSGSTANLAWQQPPSNDVVGTHRVYIQLSDDRVISGDLDSSFVMIVQNINDPPAVIGLQDSIIQAVESQRLELEFTLREIDVGDSVTFSFDPPEYNDELDIVQTSVNPNEAPDSTVSLVWDTPPDGYSLYNIITMYAEDDSGAVDTVEFTIYVKNVNTKPVYVTTQEQISAAVQDENYIQTLQARDPDASDNDTDITWVIDSTSANTPLHFVLNDTTTDTVTGQNALLSWNRPHNIDTHPDTVRGVRVMVIDTAGAFNKKWYTIPVTNVNDAPYFAPIDSQEATEGNTWSFNVVPYLLEPDSAHGDFTTYQLSQTPPNGMSIDENAGVFSWVPDNAHTLGGGYHRIFVQATDQSGAVGTGNFIIHVNNVNSPPEFLTTPTSEPDTAIANFQYLAEIRAYDPDPTDDIVTFVKGANNPAGVSVLRSDDGTDTSSAEVTWTPQPEQTGLHTIRVRVKDNFDTYADSNLVWDVFVIDTTNRAPELVNFHPDSTATQGKVYEQQFNATDPNFGDADGFVWSLPNKPANASINSSTGYVTWNAPTNDHVINSPVNITVRVTDSRGLWDQQSYPVTVANINDPPEILTTPATIAREDTLWSYEFLANDIDLATENSDSLRYAVDMAPESAWLHYDSLNQLIYGIPEQPDTQRTDITVTVTDDSAATAQQSFTLTFQNRNDRPAIETPQAFPVFTQGSLDSVKFTASDTDAVFFYDSVGFALDNLPEGESMLGDTSWFRPIDHLSAMFYWQPQNSYVPDTVITVVATDTGGLSRTITYQVAVNNLNDPPVITSLPVDTLREDVTWTYLLSSSDPDSVVNETEITYTISNAPAGMSLAGDQISWTPDNNAVGDTVIEVIGTDDFGASDTLNLALHIRNANNPPAAMTMSDTTATQDLLFTRQLQYTDPDLIFGDILTVTLDAAPATMTINSETGEITWTPTNADVPDSHKVKFTVTDSAGTSDTDSFFVAVANINDAPVHTGSPDLTVTEGEPWSYTQMEISDPDVTIGMDTLQYFALNKPADMGIDADSGAIDWTPSDADLDEDGNNITFTLGAVDSEGDSVLIPLTLTMLNQPSPPYFTNLRDTTIAQADTFEFVIQAEDPDPDGLIESYGLVTPPSPATAELNTANGELTWNPTNTDVGPAMFVLEAFDSDDSLAVDTLNIWVKNSNDAPIFTVEGDTLTFEDSLYQHTIIAVDPDTEVGAPVNLSYSLETAPPWMNISNTSTDSVALTGRPLNRHVGRDSVVVAAFDDTTYSYLRYELRVANTNDAPVIRSVVANDNKTVAEGDLWEYEFFAKDVDLIHGTAVDSLWLVGVDIPQGMELDSTLTSAGIDTVSGFLRWVPDNDAAVQGTIPVTVGVQDGGAEQVNQTFTLTVSNTNNPPSFSVDTLQIAAVERDTMRVPLTITEPDSFVGDFVNFTMGAGSEAGMVLEYPDEQSVDFRWFPENQHVGQMYYTKIIGTDQSGKQDTLVCEISVANRNTAPVLRNVIAAQILYEDSLWIDSLIVRDADVDIEEDTVRFSLENAPENVIITPEYLASGTDSVFAIQWQPDNSQVVQDSQFTVHFNDDSALTVSQTIDYTVLNTNDAPEFTELPIVTNIDEDAEYLHVFQAADDDSAYGDSLTFRIAGQPVLPDSILLDPDTGILTWTPRNYQAAATYNFQVMVQDTSELEDTLDVSLYVNNINDAPYITFPPDDTTFVIAQDSLWQIQYTLFDEDTLFDDVVSLGNVTHPVTMTINEIDSTIQWQPDSSEIGEYFVGLNISDNGGLEDTVTFSIQVEDVNDSPHFVSPMPTDSFIVDQDSLLEINLLAVDADNVYGDDYIRYRWDSTSFGFEENYPTLDSITGEFTWSPDNAQYGEHDFTSVVTDSSGLTDSLTINLFVNDLNDAPYFTRVRDTLYFTEDADSAHRALFGWDPDLYHIPPEGESPDSILFGLEQIAAPELDQVTLTTLEDTVGVIQWQPTNDQVGTYEITVGVHDTATAPPVFADTTITLIVLNRNNAPVIAEGNFPILQFPEDEEQSVNLVNYVDDQDAETEASDIRWQVTLLDSAETNEEALIFTSRSHGKGKMVKRRTPMNPAAASVHIDTSNLPIVRFYADTNFFTRDSAQVRFVAFDEAGGSDTLQRALWVSPVNDKPVLSALPDSTLDEDIPLSIDVRSWNHLAYDVETDTSDLLWQIRTQGSHFTRESVGELYTLTPDTNWFGSDSLQVIITDTSAASDTAWWHLRVLSVNDDPYFVQSPPDTFFTEDDSITLDLNQFVADVDHTLDTLTWQFVARESQAGSGNFISYYKSSSPNKSKLQTAGVRRENNTILGAQQDSVFQLGDLIFRYTHADQRVTIKGTPDYFNTAPEIFWMTVIDPLNGRDSTEFGITIHKENDPPVLSQLPVLRYNEDDSLTIRLDSLVTDVDDIIDSLHWYITLDSLSAPSYQSLGQNRSYFERFAAEDTLFVNHTPPEPLAPNPGEQIRISTSRDYFNNPGEPVPVFFGVVDTSDNRAVQRTLLRVNAVNDPPVKAKPLADRTLSQNFFRDETETLVIGLDSVFTDVDDNILGLDWNVSVDSTVLASSRYDSILVELVAGDQSITLELTPTWDFAGENAYFISVTDTSNTTAIDTLQFTVIDTIPPAVSVGVMQHPLVTSVADLYFFFSEQLQETPRPKLWVKKPGAVDSVRVPTGEFVNLATDSNWENAMMPPYPFTYHMQVKEPGVMNLYLNDVVDADNVLMRGDRVFRFGVDSIPALEKSVLSSPEGLLQLHIPRDGAEKPGYWFGYTPDIETRQTSLAKSVTLDHFTNIPTAAVDEITKFSGPVSRFAADARVSLSTEDAQQEWKQAAVVHLVNNQWELLETYYTAQSNQIWAYTDEPGTYGILWESGVPVNVLPEKYHLAQNYPNPFNPTTTIEYALPDIPGSGNGIQQVRLELFNILGQKVATLVDKPHKPGLYQVQWDGKDDRGKTLSSGVYFYRIRAGEYIKSHKMVLLR